MKAISTVIAAITMLMLTIALAGSAYFLVYPTFQHQIETNPPTAGFIARSCLEILVSGGAGAYMESGVYTIRPAASEETFKVYCDMATDGGGWTLLMKAKGGNTFHYDSNYWTTANTLNENDVNRNDGDAKYRTFNELSITDIMARWPDAGDIRWLKKSAWSPSRTALQGFNEFRNWGIPQEQPDWNPTYFSSQAKQCDNPPNQGPGAYGTKLADLGGCGGGARWGYRFNENGCNEWNSDDVSGGIGIRKDVCYIGPLKTDGAGAGDSYGCCGTLAPQGNKRMRVEIYGR